MLMTSPEHASADAWPSIDGRQRDALRNQGLEMIGDLDHNAVHIEPGFTAVNGRMVLIFEGIGNRVFVGKIQQFQGHIKFDGNGSSAYLMGGNGSVQFNTTIYSEGMLVFGRDTVCFGVTAWIHGGRTVTIGENCLFSDSIAMRTSDHHSIIDLETKAPINIPANIEIGRHVWIGPEVTLSKGVRIGDGAIIGARSVVTRSVPDRELWVGTPARRQRTNVSWVGSLPAIQEHIDELETKFGLFSVPEAGPPLRARGLTPWWLVALVARVRKVAAGGGARNA